MAEALPNGPLLRGETLCSFNQIAKQCGVNYTTVRRWVRLGVWVKGKQIKLAAVRVGGKYRTSAEAFQRFEAACNGLDPLQLQERTPAQMKRDGRRAGDMARKIFGIK